jgi:hypothetical protein
VKLAPKHVVTLIACVCAAVVLAPVGVMAATGSLVNVIDPSNSSRQAHVTSNGALRVENGSIAAGQAFSKTSDPISSLGFHVLFEVTGPTRMALTDVSLTSDTGLSQAVTGYGSRIELVALTRTSGTSACGYSAPGWTRRSLRVIDSQAPGTTQLTFPTPMLLPGAASGQPLCVGFYYNLQPNNATIWVAAGGYKYVG